MSFRINSFENNRIIYSSNVRKKNIQRMMVAVGSGTNGTIGYSVDGITWKPATNFFTGTKGWGGGVAWNGTRWVAVGSGTNETIGYSVDGITWKPATNFFKDGGGLGVACNGTRWVAVGEVIGVGEVNRTIAYSDDGITWKQVTNFFTSSTAGVNSVTAGVNGVAWNGTIWVAVGQGTNGTIAYSYDGINWIVCESDFFKAGFEVAWNGTIWVAVGRLKATSSTSSTSSTIAYSDDGINWTAAAQNFFVGTVPSPPIPPIPPLPGGYGVAWNGTRWVAVGYGTNGTKTIGYSDDGITWTEATDFFTGTNGGGIDVASNFNSLHMRELYCNIVTEEFTYYS